MDGWIRTLTDPNIIIAVLVSMAVLATFYSLAVRFSNGATSRSV